MRCAPLRNSTLLALLFALAVLTCNRRFQLQAECAKLELQLGRTSNILEGKRGRVDESVGRLQRLRVQDASKICSLESVTSRVPWITMHGHWSKDAP